jgi:hypothetical protein
MVYSGRIVSGGTNAIDNHHNYHNKYHYYKYHNYKFYHDNHHLASTPTGGPAFVAHASGYHDNDNYDPATHYYHNDYYDYHNYDDAPAHNDDDYARSYYDDGSIDYNFATHNDKFAAYYNHGPSRDDLAPDHYYYPSDYVNNIGPEGYDYFAKWDRYFNSSSS